jgi:O-antigen/teichoic acid export membrane protein
MNKATNFAIYAMVARYLGTREFGQLSLGLLLFYTAQVFTAGGLPTLITRDVAIRTSRTAEYFVSGSVAVGLWSIITTIGLFLFAVVMKYERDTILVIGLLSLGLLPTGLASVTESLFRAWERMHLIAIANVPMNVVKVLGAFLLLHNGYRVTALAILLVASRFGIILIEWCMYLAISKRVWSKIDFGFVRMLILKSSTFLGIDGIIAVWASIDAILLSKLVGETEVGLYCAAFQLFQPAILAYQSIVSSLFPMMCQKAALDRRQLTSLIRWTVDLLMLIGLPVAVGIYFFADTALLILYGDESFVAAAEVVRWMTVVLLLRTITNAFGHALWAGSREVTTLRIVTVNLAVNLVTGSVLIHQFGMMGAAWASLITWCVNTAQHYLACRQMIGDHPMGTMVWKISAAAALMAVCVAWLYRTAPVSAAVWGTGIYAGLVGILLITSHGGLHQLRARFFAPLLHTR